MEFNLSLSLSQQFGTQLKAEGAVSVSLITGGTVEEALHAGSDSIIGILNLLLGHPRRDLCQSQHSVILLRFVAVYETLLTAHKQF